MKGDPMRLPDDCLTNEQWLERRQQLERRTDRLIVLAMCLGCFLLGAMGVGFAVLVRAVIRLALRGLS